LNYLAHAYLSFLDPEITVGNLISDFVKGKKKFDFPPGIQKGITLHRAIDTFTDAHLITSEAKKVFRGDYRLYSGAIVDIIYDHFLANDELAFSEQSLGVFAQKTYSILEQYHDWLPERFARMVPYMKSQNWLLNYRERWGIARSLEGLVYRAAYLQESATAFRLFEEHYQLLGDCYRQFWKDARPFALKEFEHLKKEPPAQT
jgi:acyl carrier protein phosphodiesterase